jgi:heptosyltransferase-3
LTKLPSKARLALIRLRSLGDCVLTTPALRLLKSARPDVTTAVVVDAPFRAVYEANPDTDEVIDSRDWQSLRRFRADVALNLHGGTRSSWLTLASGASIRAGFAHFRFPWIYTVRIPRAQEILGEERPVHTAEHVASAMFALGIPPAVIPRAHLTAHPSRRPPYAVIHPFASSLEKTWPAEQFAQLARSLDLPAVIIGGPADSFGAFAPLECQRLPLAETISLIAGASLFIGNDSGPAHIAAAFGKPTVVLFGPSNPVTWAPWRTESRVLHRPNLLDLSIDEVRAAAASLGVHG